MIFCHRCGHSAADHEIPGDENCMDACRHQDLDAGSRTVAPCACTGFASIFGAVFEPPIATVNSATAIYAPPQATVPSQQALDLAAAALHIPGVLALPGDTARVRRVAAAMQRLLDDVEARTFDVRPEPSALRALAEADHVR